MSYFTWPVTIRMLEEKVDELDNITSDAVNYNLGSAYGGWRLEIIDDKHCIDATPLGNAYLSKKQCYFLVQAYINGMWDSAEFTA